MPKINPKVLIWARTTAGLSQSEAANRLGLGTPERLHALETGARVPTRRQLSTMAEKYHRSLLALYLSNPPPSADRGQDFRTLPEGISIGSEAILSALIRDVQARQQLVRSALEETEEDVPIKFVGSAQMEDGVDKLVNKMRKTLGLSIEQFRKQKGVSDAFALLRDKTENAGVF